jgi:hypothetical protein
MMGSKTLFPILSPAPRSCGGCRACCVEPSFVEGGSSTWFSKPRGVPCPYLADTGCAIYEDRPDLCRRFECEWLVNAALGEELRPDRCGVIFCPVTSPLDGEPALYALEVRAGALDSPEPRRVVAAAPPHTTVILFRKGARPTILRPQRAASRD